MTPIGDKENNLWIINISRWAKFGSKYKVIQIWPGLICV
jgi:hypothetical protein